MTTIAPCPACGGTADIWGCDTAAWIGCDNSRCALCGSIEDSESQAIAAWNRLSAAAELARHMAAWLLHLSHWTELPDDAVVLAVASPEPTEAVRITAGMIRDAAGR